uniref:Neurotrophic-like factor n=1 Tax=Tritonia tetraquetra TaxID=2780533 RepID=I1SKI4_9GAST|nr:neurotrophic-like factor precursor [Tritonia tetraquetra]
MTGQVTMTSAAVAVVFLFLVNVAPVTMTSDPGAMLCERVCWDENTLAEQCEQDNGCDAGVQSSDAYMHCIDPCYVEAASCFMMCHTNFQRILNVCREVCTDITTYLQCANNCFIDRALRLKFGQRNQVPESGPPPPPGA